MLRHSTACTHAVTSARFLPCTFFTSCSTCRLTYFMATHKRVLMLPLPSFNQIARETKIIEMHSTRFLPPRIFSWRALTYICPFPHTTCVLPRAAPVVLRLSWLSTTLSSCLFSYKLERLVDVPYYLSKPLPFLDLLSFWGIFLFFCLYFLVTGARRRVIFRVHPSLLSHASQPRITLPPCLYLRPLIPRLFFL